MRSLNLLPWRDRLQRTHRREAIAALLCGLIGALGMVVLGEFHFRGKLHEVRQRASQLEATIAVHQQAAVQSQALDARNADLGALLEELERVRGHNRAVRDWLEQLPAAVPAELRLQRLAIRGTAWELQGVAHNLETAALLLQTIRVMPMVSEARIEQVRSDSVQARDFLLAGEFNQ